MARVSNSRLNNCITNILNFTVYKIFRILYRTNSKNSETMFEIPDEIACRMAQAGAEINEGNAAAVIKNGEQNAPEISTVLIESEFPKQAPALLSLIKSSETQLKKMM